MTAAHIRWGRDDDSPAVAAIWRDVCTWLESIGQPLWSPDQLGEARAREWAKAGELVVGLSNDAIVACMTLIDIDPVIWPDEIQGAALYVHKLAVTRTQAGKGWSQAMLDWAATAAAARGIGALRLDCAPRPELLRLYADCGFTRLDSEPQFIGGYHIVRFERRIDARTPEPKPGSGDYYPNFAALAAAESLGVTYGVRSIDRASPVLVIAPHGGAIEVSTSQIAEAIAADCYSFYAFEGLVPGREHQDLHITSVNFDEPVGCRLVAAADIVVAVHGRQDRDDPETIWLGGLDDPLRDAIGATLRLAGFAAITTGHLFPGRQPENICNRGRRGAGVQLEIPATIRDRLSADAAALDAFSNAVRNAVRSG